jgi:hypothetical protein
MQQEMLKLYQEEKVNPVAGCLPILLQIPIFYALYKVLMLAVEMRHEPFALWIKDLSAPDPLTPVKPVRLPRFHAACFLALGICRSCWDHHVAAVQAQSRADGPDPEAGVRDHALGADVRDGAVRGRPSALLDGVQRSHHRSAEVALQPLSGAQHPAEAK